MRVAPDTGDDTEHVRRRPRTHRTNLCPCTLYSHSLAFRWLLIGRERVLQVMNVFEEFLGRKAPGGSEAAPFMAHLWLHTNHEPHPAVSVSCGTMRRSHRCTHSVLYDVRVCVCTSRRAMRAQLPQFYFAYNDTDGNPAGDYLGTLTQMDAQIGRLRKMLRAYGVANNTLLWFLSDNGPHVMPGEMMPAPRDVRASTNGLRQCKASLFEGGIRVPSILEWPARIRSHREISTYPAGAYDMLPTVLDILGLTHPQPSWQRDGLSLLPLIDGAPEATRPADRPLCFELGTQATCIDNEWKIVRNPVKGQCAWNDGRPPAYSASGGTRSTDAPQPGLSASALKHRLRQHGALGAFCTTGALRHFTPLATHISRHLPSIVSQPPVAQLAERSCSTSAMTRPRVPRATTPSPSCSSGWGQCSRHGRRA